MALVPSVGVPGFLTSDQVAEKLEVPYRALMRWVEEGLLVPYVAGSRKRAPRLWSEQHVTQARLVRTLRQDGIPTEAVKTAMDALRADGSLNKRRFLVVSRHGEDAWVCDERERMSLFSKTGGRLFIVVDLEEAARE